ncbi:MAG TPA: squalene/phytoene synthase family protein [Thermoanaerobaculia bacterium]|nr:squalene/phytoene synthase family protein [Thermoanaerobaculia bacterium]
MRTASRPHTDSNPEPLSSRRLDALLADTSRTFALAIPLLPQPIRRQVTLAYLVFRIADTFEDADLWSREKRIAALAELGALLDEHDLDRARAAARDWLRQPPVEHQGYLDLLGSTPQVLAAIGRLEPGPRRVLVRHTLRTAQGMAGFVRSSDDHAGLELTDLSELRRYCYVVAGIVGELLTDLVLLACKPLAGVAHSLRRSAASFGEGLQLVNILKDSAGDARVGRRFLPQGLPAAEIFALARRDLESARDYVLSLHQAAAPRGVIAFNALPLLLARATLDRVERDGPGAKIKRGEVFAILRRLHRDLAQGSAPV